MTAQELLSLFLGQQPSREFLKQSERCRTLEGASLAGSSFSLLVAGTVLQHGGLHVVVMEDRDAAGYLYNDLFPFLDEQRLLFFPTAYKRSIQFGQEDPGGIVQRTTALGAIRNLGKGTLVICTYPEALVEKVVGRQQLASSSLNIRVGDSLSTSFVEDVLRENGFERVEFVYEPGQYSLRGGIIDVFSFADNRPYRIDFFGDEIDSLRYFDLGTQLSVQKLDEVEIVPQSQGSGRTTGFVCPLCRGSDLLVGRRGVCPQTVRRHSQPVVGRIGQTGDHRYVGYQSESLPAGYRRTAVRLVAG